MSDRHSHHKFQQQQHQAPKGPHDFGHMATSEGPIPSQLPRTSPPPQLVGSRILASSAPTMYGDAAAAPPLPLFDARRQQPPQQLPQFLAPVSSSAHVPQYQAPPQQQQQQQQQQQRPSPAAAATTVHQHQHQHQHQPLAVAAAPHQHHHHPQQYSPPPTQQPQYSEPQYSDYSEPQYSEDVAAASYSSHSTPSPAVGQVPIQLQAPPVRGGMIDETAWFIHTTGGVGEEMLRYNRGQYISMLQQGKPPGSKNSVPQLAIRNEQAGLQVSAGMFHLPSLRSLRAALPTGARCPCTFVLHSRRDTESIRFVDVAALQADPANTGAMFQAASNFNAVEAIRESETPDGPSFTERYVYDRTQGPTASIGAPAAAIARVHAAFYDPAKPPGTWAQTADHQLQMLGNLTSFFTVRNGYVVNTGSEQLLPTDPAQLEKMVDMVRVGVHLGVDVLFGARTPQGMEVLPKPHKIHQVFCAAMNIGQGPSGMQNAALPGARMKAKLLLVAAYRGTYLAALANGCKKLFLTMIGGGVFGNDFGDIFEAIYKAHTELALGANNVSLSEVHLVLFSDPPHLDEFTAALKHTQAPFRHVAYTQGQPAVVSSFP